MRTFLALCVLALGCSDPTTVTGDAASAACGDPPDGQVWSAQPGCIPVCIRNGRGVLTCRPDAGPAYCPAENDVHNCGDCGHDCATTECRPFNGATYSAACRLERCECTRTN